MTDRERERRARRKLAVLRHAEEVSDNVAATCRYHGISRQCYYGWLRRYRGLALSWCRQRLDRCLRAVLPMAGSARSPRVWASVEATPAIRRRLPCAGEVC